MRRRLSPMLLFLTFTLPSLPIGQVSAGSLNTLKTLEFAAAQGGSLPLLAASEVALDAEFDAVFRALADNPTADRTALVQGVCLKLTTELRRFAGGPFPSRLWSVRADPTCQVDVIADTPFLKYCLAATTGNTAAALLALHDFATVTNACLSAEQTLALENNVVLAYQQTLTFIQAHGLLDLGESLLLQVVANPLLMLFDANKHQGSALPLGQWLATNLQSLWEVSRSPSSLAHDLGWWLYDRRRGGVQEICLSADAGAVELPPRVSLSTDTASLGNAIVQPGSGTGGNAQAPGCSQNHLMKECPALAEFLGNLADPAILGDGTCALADTAARNLPCLAFQGQCPTSPVGQRPATQPGGYCEPGYASDPDFDWLTEDLFCVPSGGVRAPGGVADPSPPKQQWSSENAFAKEGSGSAYHGVKGTHQCKLWLLTGEEPLQETPQPPPSDTPPADNGDTNGGGGDTTTGGTTNGNANNSGSPSETFLQKVIKAAQELLKTLAASAAKLAGASEGKATEAVKYALDKIANFQALDAATLDETCGGTKYGCWDPALETIFVLDEVIYSADGFPSLLGVLVHEGTHAMFQAMGFDNADQEENFLEQFGLTGNFCSPLDDTCSGANCSALAEQIGRWNVCTPGIKGTPSAQNLSKTWQETCVVADADGWGGGFTDCGKKPAPPPLPGTGNVAGSDPNQIVGDSGGIITGKPPKGLPDTTPSLSCTGLSTEKTTDSSACWTVDCGIASDSPVASGVGSLTAEGTELTKGADNKIASCCTSATGAGPSINPQEVPGFGFTDPNPVKPQADPAQGGKKK